MKLISRSCPLCGSSDAGQVFAEANFDPQQLDGFAFASRKVPEYMHHRLIDCPVCDLLYANPLPSQDYLTEGYGEAAYDSAVEAHYAAATYAGVLAGFVRQLPDFAGALDIGTGDGAFLENLLEMGFREVAGVEPSRAPIAAAREDVRPLIREGIFRGQDYPPQSLSLVTCFQTLEHLSDPVEMTRQVYHLLKPGGAAFFICHDRRAFSAKVLGRKSPIFDMEHLQLFSDRSARFLLEHNGFTGVRVVPVLNRYPLRYWLRLLPLPRGMKLRLISLLDGMRIGGWPVSIPVGNIAVIGFKKGD
jgi:SAM-dependent methyltransferase